MIINVKNPDLYRAWLRYFRASPEPMPDHEIRTYAFFNSQEGKLPPLFR